MGNVRLTTIWDEPFYRAPMILKFEAVVRYPVALRRTRARTKDKHVAKALCKDLWHCSAHQRSKRWQGNCNQCDTGLNHTPVEIRCQKYCTKLSKVGTDRFLGSHGSHPMQGRNRLKLLMIDLRDVNKGQYLYLPG